MMNLNLICIYKLTELSCLYQLISSSVNIYVERVMSTGHSVLKITYQIINPYQMSILKKCVFEMLQKSRCYLYIPQMFRQLMSI